ncbi:hypothetical protein FOA52_009329 [Chlamydomonas sp. UWO 241]|nr:hypothetical protein FOA52_009329 [Chlamydomonas sp. UWO 241]
MAIGSKPAGFKPKSEGSGGFKSAGGAMAHGGGGNALSGGVKKPYKADDKAFKAPVGAGGAKATAAERKAAKKSKSAGLKKNFNLINDAALLWETLRPKETAVEDKHKIVDQVLEKMKGKILELANHHTASRIIQLCAKTGTPSQRAAIMTEVKASIVDLSKTKYGHHFVQRLIALAKKDEIGDFIAAFKGKVAELLRHPHGADVMTDLYDGATSAQRNAMCAEFYGKEFILFDGSVGGQASSSLSSLRQLLAGAPARQRRAVYGHMTRALMPVMEKAILHPPMTHRLIRDFMECAPSMSVEDAVDTLSQSGTDVLKMVHTHEGSAVVCMLIAYGSAKDRKRIIKAMKGHVHDMAINEWGHAVLCTALTVIDDTSLVVKTIVAELKAMLPEAVEDQYASRVLLQLLSPDDKHYLPVSILELIHPAPRTIMSGTGKMVTDIEGDEDEVDIHADTFGDLDGDDDGDMFAPSKKGGDKKAGGKKGKEEETKEAAGAGKGKGAGKRARADGGDEPSTSGQKGGGDGDEDGDEEKPSGPRVLGISKKDPIARRRELLGSGGASLATALCAVVAECAGPLLRSPHGCAVVVEVARGGEGGLLSELCPDGVQAVQAAVAALVRRVEDAPDESTAGGDDAPGVASGPAPQQEHVMTQWHASRALRRLVLSASGEGAAPPAAAAVELLWASALRGRCGEWAGGHGDKVLAALLRCGVPSVSGAAAKELKPLIGGQDPDAWADAKGGKGKVEKQAKGGKGKGEGKPAKAAKAAAGDTPRGTAANFSKPTTAAGTPKAAVAAKATPKATPVAAPKATPKATPSKPVGGKTLKSGKKL